MRPTDTEQTPRDRATAPLMIFRPVSREQRLKSLLKPVRPMGKMPRR
ncbi:hypothetical protein [Caulobacter sp. CCH9-E1]|jgi:hypothetical protein